VSFVLLPNLRIASAGAPGAAQPAEDPTVWVKADDLDGSSNSTLVANQELADVTNHGTAPFDFEGQTNPPTYKIFDTVTGSQYVSRDSIDFTGVSDNDLRLGPTGGPPPPATMNDIILSGTWEVFGVARSTSWPGGSEFATARLFGGMREPSAGTWWGLHATNQGSGNKWSGFAADTNNTYVQYDGLDDTDQIVRYRGENVTGSVYQYLKVDENPEQETLMGPATPGGIDNGDSPGMDMNPRIGDSRGTGDTEYEGKVYEILVYNSVLTEQERTDTYDYLYAKWFNLVEIPFPTPDFSSPDNSTVSSFEFSGWPGTVANPITSSDFTTYDNSATSSYEFSGWPGTVANPITSSDFATYNNSATASFELGPWEFSFGTGSLSTQYEFGQGWPGTLDIAGILGTQFTASLHSASTTYEFDGWPGTTDPPT